MSGRNAYIGASEVTDLIGRWQQIVGADTSYTPYARYGQPYNQYNPYQQGQQFWPQPHPHHPHHRRHPWPANPYARSSYPAAPGGYQPAAPASMRDHRRQYWQNRAWVSSGGDQIAVGALALMGAEEAAAAEAGVPPPDAIIPAPPVDPAAPIPPPEASIMPPPPPAMSPGPPMDLAPPMPPPTEHHHRHRHHHRHHGGNGGPPPGYSGPPPGYGFEIPPRNAMVDYAGPSRADRVVLPMSSGVNILPNTSAQITSRPQNVAFRPERLIIGGTPGDWIVNDIKVGNRSQFSQSGDVPGEMFAATTIDSFVSFETVQTAMDFVVLVTFVGVSEVGSPFVCGVLGTAAI